MPEALRCRIMEQVEAEGAGSQILKKEYLAKAMLISS